LRGGAYRSFIENLPASFRDALAHPSGEDVTLGFRLALVPAPATALLAIAGIGLLARRRRRN
jgi:hypothetical protein